jgi:hypothetical protein
MSGFMKKYFVFIRLLLLFSVCILLFSCNSEKKEINPQSKGDITITGGLESPLKTGFAAVQITPEVPDRWIDNNNDAKYNPRDGDTFTDGNGNGIFDPVWIAGFGNRRAANGIHDDLWARTMVIDDGITRLAIVSLDVIGFMNNCVNDVRNLISEEAGITYLIISSTHTHEGPDLLGLWGKIAVKTGVNKEYLEYVKVQIVKSVETASGNLQPSYLTISEDMTGGIPLVRDSRKPEVFDNGLRIIRAINKKDGGTMGTLISWADHPETLWGNNLMITSDFPHFVREGVEKGISDSDSLIIPGIGGIAVYITGAIGGLMTTSPGLAVKDPVTGVDFKEPTFEKAHAQGNQLAMLALNSMMNPVERIDSAAISLVVRTIRLPLRNKLFKLAKILGVIDRGKSGLNYMYTELAVLKIGPLSFVTFPGEVYPEIVNGGIEAPDGNDFSVEPLEIPPVREMMPGKYKFILGLTNDEIGYIIPKSEWDTKKPYTYGSDNPPYGEENSIGPETATILHRKLQEMIAELK